MYLFGATRTLASWQEKQNKNGLRTSLGLSRRNSAAFVLVILCLQIRCSLQGKFLSNKQGIFCNKNVGGNNGYDGTRVKK